MPTVSDRVAQAVVKAYLEPEVERHFHADAYGYRPGKSALEAVGVARQRCWRYNWVLDLDIRRYFDRICHRALVSKLHTFPVLRRTITAWLKAGVRDGEDLFPTETGAPQGGVLSPLLMNVALHGLETAITTAFPASQDGRRWQPRVIRYADGMPVQA